MKYTIWQSASIFSDFPSVMYTRTFDLLDFMTFPAGGAAAGATGPLGTETLTF